MLKKSQFVFNDVVLYYVIVIEHVSFFYFLEGNLWTTRFAGSVIHTSRLTWRSLSFSVRTLCCSALSVLRFSCSETENTFLFTPSYSEEDQVRLTFYFWRDVSLPFSPWGPSVPPPPSSFARSDHRWGTAAQEYPCCDVSSECPALRHARNNLVVTLTNTYMAICILKTPKDTWTLTSKSTFSPSGILGADGLWFKN